MAARQAYEFINKNTAENVHIQQNPNDLLNRPIGLYADRPMAVSGHTAYGISRAELVTRANLVAKIFTEYASWDEIDQSCLRNYIDIIVVSDEDPLWMHLPALEQARAPLYRNSYYAIFACGNNDTH